MVVSPSEIPLGHRSLAKGAVSEFYTSVSAGRVRANNVFTVLNAIVDDKVGGLL